MVIEEEIDLGEFTQIQKPKYLKGSRIEEKFLLFHETNPHVLDKLLVLANWLKGQGWEKAGLKQLFEQLRWKYAIKTKGSRWRLNNNFTAYYSRMLMDVDQRLAGFFETRETNVSTSE